MKTKADVDNLAEDGARSLARRIAVYWETRGYVVHCWAEPVVCANDNKKKASDDAKTIRFFVVRSDLVNGLPTRRREAA
jgi:hypothetical protein